MAVRTEDPQEYNEAQGEVYPDKPGAVRDTRCLLRTT